jgi:hypothetical protein
MQDYIRKILAARIYDVAIESLLDLLPRLSQRLGSPVHLKRKISSRCSRSSSVGPTTRWQGEHKDLWGTQS